MDKKESSKDGNKSENTLSLREFCVVCETFVDELEKADKIAAKRVMELEDSTYRLIMKSALESSGIKVPNWMER